MKRISILAIVLLITVTTVTKAQFYDYPSVRYQTRWSPYAFTYKRSGLISGYYGYSPYAFSFKNPGFVKWDVRWSPYAFTNKTSGLIHDYIGYSPYAFECRYSGLVDKNYTGRFGYCPPSVTIVKTADKKSCARSYSSSSSDETAAVYKQSQLSRKERIHMQMDARKKIKSEMLNDAVYIINGYLKSRNIDDFKMTGILKIEGSVINVSFILKDRNLIITYWDMDKVKSLIQQPGYYKTYLERHEKQWEELCDQYTQAGGKVYPITSVNGNEILAKLKLCPELNDG